MHRPEPQTVHRHLAEIGELYGNRCYRWSEGTHFFGEARVSGLRHLRSAARAAFVQFQFTVWRVPRVQRTRVQIRFRSIKNYHRLDAPALRWRPWARFRIRDFEADAGTRRVRARL